jgi:hypothetical protein
LPVRAKQPTANSVTGFSPVLTRAWLAQARGEYASVRGFRVHAAELEQLSAPGFLVEQAKVAMADELRHAKTCEHLAVRYHSDTTFSIATALENIRKPVGEERKVAGDLQSMLTVLVGEGCWGETIGTMVASQQLRLTQEVEVKQMLAVILKEEMTHCALSWLTVAWALSVDATLLPHVKLVLKTLSERSAPAVPALQPVKDDQKSLEQYGVLTISTMDFMHQVKGPKLVQALFEHLLTQFTVQQQQPGQFNPDAYGFLELVERHVRQAAVSI